MTLKGRICSPQRMGAVGDFVIESVIASSAATCGAFRLMTVES